MSCDIGTMLSNISVMPCSISTMSCDIGTMLSNISVMPCSISTMSCDISAMTIDIGNMQCGAQLLSGRIQDSQSREPGLESPLLVFRSSGFQSLFCA